MSDLHVDSVESEPAMPMQQQEEDRFEGTAKDFLVLNGFPHYQEGHVLANRCQIFERIGWDDRLGPTYLAMGPEGKELVVRVGNEDTAVVKMEAAFLCKAEQEHEWLKFSQVHSIFNHDDCTFLALFFRGGPTLQQCFDFSKGRFSHGTAARLAGDVFSIIRTVHKMGYMLRSLDLDQFHLCAASRHLFMADISDLRKSQENVEMTWKGGPLFAPLAAHSNQPVIYERDEYEAWFMLLVYLVRDLPWRGQCLDDIKWTKIGALNGGLFDDLPEQYRQIYETINAEPSDRPMGAEDLNKIQNWTTEIWKKIGGVEDQEDNYDFEREPAEEELPRFVAERVPVMAPIAEEEETQKN